jgi:hypothetical protein
MVASQPTPARDPGNAALNHPSSGKGPKAGRKELVPVDLLSLGNEQTALGHGERAHRLHGPAQLLFEPSDEGPAVVAVAPHQLDSGKGLFQRLTQHPRAGLIGALGSQHFDGQEVALRVNEQVPFAPPDFFPSGQRLRGSSRRPALL